MSSIDIVLMLFSSFSGCLCDDPLDELASSCSHALSLELPRSLSVERNDRRVNLLRRLEKVDCRDAF